MLTLIGYAWGGFWTLFLMNTYNLSVVWAVTLSTLAYVPIVIGGRYLEGVVSVSVTKNKKRRKRR